MASAVGQRLHIWDFDGVLSESLRECLTVLALAVYRRSHPDEPLSDMAIAKACSKQNVDELERWMRPIRPFIVRGQDYLWQYDARELLVGGFDSRKEYDAVMRQMFNQQQDDEYAALFYQSRELLAKNLGDHYLSLFTCYRGAVHAFRLSNSRHQTFICTNRDRQAVETVMAPYQIEVARNRIYSRDYNGELANKDYSKLDQVRMIIDQNSSTEQSIVLIEDQPELPACLIEEYPNLKVLYASYGYGLKEDWAREESSAITRIEKPADLIYELY